MYTLNDAVAIGGPDPIARAVVEMFIENSPWLAALPLIPNQGRSYTYNREDSIGSASFRAINSTWPESTGVVNPETERPAILGGEFKVDTALLNTEPDGGVGLKTTAVRQKIQAASNLFDQAVVEGDQSVDPNSIIGLRRRITSNQVFLQATNGGPLTLAALNQMMDSVIGPDSSKLLVMNKGVQRKLTDLATVAGGGTGLLSYDKADLGRRWDSYRGVKIGVMETRGDASSVLGYDETEGSSSVTTSIYCVYLDTSDGMGGFYTGRKTLTVKDFEEQQAGPYHMGRLEMIVGVFIKQPRAAGRLRGITAA